MSAVTAYEPKKQLKQNNNKILNGNKEIEIRKLSSF